MRIKNGAFGMSQIFRIVRPEFLHISRVYGISRHRNLHNHYETLRVAPSATQKDIREAFIKLSKQMHPDLSKSSSHADFVKLSEAYKILSKEHTRRDHDVELRNGASKGRPIRVVYYDPEDKEWVSPVYGHDFNASSRYTGRRGITKLSKITIVFLCILLSAIGITAEVFVISTNMALKRERLIAHSSEYAEMYRKLRSEAESKDHAERVAEIQRILKCSDSEDTRS